ncbi:hypothetical protein [Streptomyces candidus]|uniref:Type IV secretory pathway VirB10-like protein n=1 Tax=Streptomyces candidus TaxID=67283 RepID=A0A7X0LSF1_9ACTN|nr:hypothetical protein [Streptomyces candidus]MBB6439137.1 type IV secretory pathway VirB10-like protein [Streptomyces candidus]GHH57532.1 hypothetical protein GCM10018773_64980 [Streptomyces candidus]
MKRILGTHRYLISATALCALALTACGTTQADNSGPATAAKPAKGADAAAAPKPDAEPGPEESAQLLTFMTFLNKVAEPCSLDLPKEPPLADEAPATPPASPPPPISDGPPPSPDELNPGSYKETEEDKKAEAQLETMNKCVTKAHTDRVTKAVKGLKAPTQVRGSLNRSGYVDSVLKTREQPGTGTRFSLDLGSLCLTGTADGSASPSVQGHEVLDPENPCPRL